MHARLLLLTLFSLFTDNGQTKELRIEELQIPPSEPLTVPLVVLDENNDNITYKAKIKDLKVFGISSYELSDLKVDMKKGKMILRLAIPLVSLAADYEIDGKYYSAPVEGTGKFNANLTNFQADLVVVAEVIQRYGDEQFRIKEIKVQTQMTKAKGFFTNFHKPDKELSERTNSLLNATALDILKEVRPAVEMVIAILAEDIGNKISTFQPYSSIFNKS